MSEEQQLLADIPEFFSVNTLLKATPHEEAGERFIYFEASNEGIDQQGERVLSKALEDSASYYKKFGNIDLDHYTIIGAKSGIPNPMSYEIGRPVEVVIKDSRTFVKAQLYKGDGALAENANMVWESMTALSPPARWYPSVGGAVLAKSVAKDPISGRDIGVVTKVRWTNVALSRTPVNQHIPTAQTLPIGVFAKSLNGFVLNKALEASYCTDVSQLTGGGALGMQSLDTSPASYYDFRDKLSGDIIGREAKLETLDSLIDYTSAKFLLPRDEAAEWVDRFLRDIKRKLN